MNRTRLISGVRTGLLALVSLCALHTHTYAQEKLASAMKTALSHSSDYQTLSHSAKRISYTSCLPCHGEEGRGKQDVFAPALAGQKRWYLERQIKNYQQGIRGMHSSDIAGASMRAMSLLLLDQDVMNSVLDEIEEFPIPPTVQLNNQSYNIESGKERYTISCAHCHGERAEGDQALGAPRLNTLPAWYTLRQLRNFQAGIRGQHNDDRRGKEMRPMAMAVYNEQEIQDVAAYIATLQDKDLSH